VVRTDVVVVGAGPSGATAALLLARRGHRVLVLDRARFPRDKACGEGLMPPGVALLRRLGLHEQVMATGARPIEGVTYRHAKGGTPQAYAPFPPAPGGGPSGALGVRRTRFDAVLVDALRDDPLITLREGVRATGLLRDRAGHVAGVTTPTEEISARVIVGADGLHSHVRAMAGLRRAQAPSARYGLAGHWRLDTRDRRAIIVSFDRGHEWYEAPVAPDLLLVSVLTQRSRAPITAHTYAEAARDAIPVLCEAELVAGPLGAAQFHQRARTVAEGRVFLVGDAAGYDDPTTGEGIAIGMLLAERLAHRIDGLLGRRITLRRANERYREDHARLVRDRHRLTELALLMARNPWLSRRAIARAATHPRTLSKLLGINCGYQTFWSVSPRDWLALAGI